MTFSFPSFFLGVGFMLMETKGITELAKIYGSTWFVVSIVITAILSMAYLANLFIIKGIKILSTFYFIISKFLIFFIFIGIFKYLNKSSVWFLEGLHISLVSPGANKAASITLLLH